MEELGVECWVGHPAKIRAYEPRKQKNDRRDARLLMHLLEQDIFPRIWVPSVEQRDVRALLMHRHQWVRIRVRIRMHCNRSRSVMDCAEGRDCGAGMDNFRCWHYRSPSTRMHDATS